MSVCPTGRGAAAPCPLPPTLMSVNITKNILMKYKRNSYELSLLLEANVSRWHTFFRQEKGRWTYLSPLCVEALCSRPTCPTCQSGPDINITICLVVFITLVMTVNIIVLSFFPSIHSHLFSFTTFLIHMNLFFFCF